LSGARGRLALDERDSVDADTISRLRDGVTLIERKTTSRT